MTKVAIITCYKYPDYGRAVTLRSGLQANPNIHVIVIKNDHRGILRYPEVLLKTWRARRKQKPDVYLLTFRSYEMLWPTLLIAGRKPVIFDELINPLEVVDEHRKLRKGTFTGALMKLWSIFGGVYRRLVRRCQTILADTKVHADYSAKLSNIDPTRYVVIPVGADEDIFKPTPKSPTKDHFEVLFYGSMVPLHGLNFMLDAAEILKDHGDIYFRFIGGGKDVADWVDQAAHQGAYVTYEPRVDVEELPVALTQADLCLGGPFGNTTQSHLVVTGKTYQSLASARPALIGKCPASTQAGFKDGKNCLLVPQGDSQALADKILWAQGHPAELNRIAKAGHKLYQERFSQKVINEDLARLVL